MEKNMSSDQYHTVSIRNNLPVIDKCYQEECLRDFPPIDYWKTKLNLFRNSSTVTKTEKYTIQYSIINQSYTSECVNHPILTAFLYAYNSHEDVILSPDDIWLMICIYYAKYVNENASKLTHLYLKNEKLRLITIDNEETSEFNWEDFLQQIHRQMTNHIRNDLCQLLTNHFSTTTKVESLLSSLTMMSTFQKCHECTSMINSSGIRNVQFMGILDDWILVREKTKQLQLFTRKEDDFYRYIGGILPILDQFILTYQGQVNNQFWDTIFDLNHQNDNSNHSHGTYINGWFLRLCYGIHTKDTSSLTSIELNSLIVPIVVENEHTNTLKTSYLVGGFHGVRSHDQKHRPVLSFVILDDEEDPTILNNLTDQ